MLWLKAFHVIAVVCWFAGLFYLPRLFVYHAMTSDDSTRQQFKVMSHKLYYYIMWPSMVATVVFGLSLLFLRHHYYAQLMWMHVKLVLVMLLVAYHFLCGHYLKAFLRDQNTHSHRFYRIFNEIPTVLLICIVILSIVQP